MPFEDDLARLDQRIVKLRIEFDLFFSGALPRPPLETRDALDKEVKRLGNTREMKLAQRFLYNNVLNRWNLFNELWNKRLQAREEGVRTPPVARRRRQAEETVAPSPAPGVSSPAARPESSRRLLARAAVRSASDSPEGLKSLYRSFLEAQQESGAGRAPSYERFCKEIQRQAEAIRQKSPCERVDFRLYLENNKVCLRARPLKEEEKPA